MRDVAIGGNDYTKRTVIRTFKLILTRCAKNALPKSTSARRFVRIYYSLSHIAPLWLASPCRIQGSTAKRNEKGAGNLYHEGWHELTSCYSSAM